MIIAIDDTGSFGANDKSFSFFVAVQMRQRKAFHQDKLRSFRTWEARLPARLKDHNGEIKGRALNDRQLVDFVRRVLGPPPNIWITAVGSRAEDNPPGIVAKHDEVVLRGIRAGVEWYRNNARPDHATTYDEFSHWFRKLSYAQHMKMRVLGECIGHAQVNAYGTSIVGGFDMELPRMRYIIDRDLVTNERANIFWHEFLRNQIYNFTRRHPIPHLNTWATKGHPVLDKFQTNGRPDYRALFWEQTKFAKSHLTPELRMADVTATIVSRGVNRLGAEEAYRLMRPIIAGKARRPFAIQLNDFDLDAWAPDQADNPWAETDAGRDAAVDSVGQNR